MRRGTRATTSVAMRDVPGRWKHSASPRFALDATPRGPLAPPPTPGPVGRRAISNRIEKFGFAIEHLRDFRRNVCFGHMQPAEPGQRRPPTEMDAAGQLRQHSHRDNTEDRHSVRHRDKSLFQLKTKVRKTSLPRKRRPGRSKRPARSFTQAQRPSAARYSATPTTTRCYVDSQCRRGDLNPHALWEADPKSADA